MVLGSEKWKALDKKAPDKKAPDKKSPGKKALESLIGKPQKSGYKTAQATFRNKVDIEITADYENVLPFQIGLKTGQHNNVDDSSHPKWFRFACRDFKTAKFTTC